LSPRKENGKGGKGARNPFARFFLSGWFWVPAVTLVVIYVLNYFWKNFTEWWFNSWTWLFHAYGYGLVLVFIFLLVATVFAWRRGWRYFFRRWHWWVGGLLIGMAVWGGLAYFKPAEGGLAFVGYGGVMGRDIAGVPDIGNAFKLLGIFFAGCVFVNAEWVWQAFKWLALGSSRSARALWRTGSRKPARPVTDGGGPPPVRRKAAVDQPEEPRPEPVMPVINAPRPAVSGEETSPERKPPMERYKPVITAGGWQLPPPDVLDKPTEMELSQGDIEKRARLIEESLASYGVEAKVVQINVGPTVTQFGVEPGWDRKYREVKEKDKDGNEKTVRQETGKTRVKVERITALSDNLQLALSSPGIRIEAPVPGKPMVGIEVPNTSFGTVNLRSVIETSAYQKLKARSRLALALGKGAGGQAEAADLAKMPHLLIAGTTGSGKSACIHSIIACLIMHNTPDEVKFIMVDPKRVELVNYNGLPHLIAPSVVESPKAVLALRWLVEEMDRRYRQFADAGARNIEGYNKDRPAAGILPYLVLVIDELADLMMVAFDDVERDLCRLAQLARATGIHLIVATQRPSVDVITGLIKANFPTRLSFAVTSQVDSRTILDAVGAEKLLGRGDMLFMPTDASKPKRLQGTFIGDAEIARLVKFWGDQRRPGATQVNFDEVKPLPGSDRAPVMEDPLLEEARRLVEDHGQVSASYLQRQLRIGYPRAARLAEQLRAEGLEADPERDEP
jgi:S-DNA-T family DNA segregation ATPase FtsK/SpoIIIE